MDYTIGETFTLPSLGKIYGKEFDPNITLRSMKTNDEMKRLGRTDRPLGLMSEIIDDCLVTKLPISQYDMCVGDYEFLLHKLRIVTYGPEYLANLTCPNCGQPEKKIISLEDLKVSCYSDDLEFEKYRTITLPKCKKIVTIKFRTPRDLDDIQIRQKDLAERSESNDDYSYLLLITQLIESIDGSIPDPFKLDKFVRELDMADTNAIIKAGEKINSLIGLKQELHNKCSQCGLDYTRPFRQTSEFFRPSI